MRTRQVVRWATLEGYTEKNDQHPPGFRERLQLILKGCLAQGMNQRDRHLLEQDGAEGAEWWVVVAGAGAANDHLRPHAFTEVITEATSTRNHFPSDDEPASESSLSLVFRS